MSNGFNSIKKECGKKGISRLCHFTSSRNLGFILKGEKGILATRHLEEDERALFIPTDLKRLDGHKNHICCSIEYPNPWFFSSARSKEALFKDWVVLLIKPDYLWEEKTLFCPCNAAASYGNRIKSGITGFLDLFQAEVSGSQGKRYTRTSTHLLCCPTDNQAEVLVLDCIQLSDIFGVIVRDRTQAKNEILRLKMSNIDQIPDIFVSLKMFDKYGLSEAISSGVKPTEKIFRR
ncbi:MAG: DUF4433 domain-containing protein [Candidatus Omnitrophica bacterium]|jgi:hypothetical protein|nr:DUF4433 domain-containing protein [Candidatus Omnitrophota bacterium]